MYPNTLSPYRWIPLHTRIIRDKCYGTINKIRNLPKKEKLELFKISAVTKEGVESLIDYVSSVLKDLPKEDLIEVEEKMVYTLEDKKDDWEITIENGIFKVSGKAVQRLMGRINIEDNESM